MTLRFMKDIQRLSETLWDILEKDFLSKFDTFDKRSTSWRWWSTKDKTSTSWSWWSTKDMTSTSWIWWSTMDKTSTSWIWWSTWTKVATTTRTICLLSVSLSPLITLDGFWQNFLCLDNFLSNLLVLDRINWYSWIKVHFIWYQYWYSLNAHGKYLKLF